MGDAVDAHQLGGDALAHLRVMVRFPQDGQPRVGVQVYEPGTDHVTGRIDGAGRLQPGHVAPLDSHPVSLHQDCGKEAGAAGAVNN